MAIPLPGNEVHRLAVLREIDSGDQMLRSELDELCELAAGVARTPVALVSLVGADTQIFVGNFGLSSVPGTPRSMAFCSHTIMSPQPMIVDDTTADDRFSSSPLVTGEFGFRAYAGIPLELEPGVRIGTLCAIDYRRRRFSDRQIEKLGKLARAVAGLLKARRTQLALEREIAGRKVREIRLQHAANHDILTGLPNLRCFRRNAEDELTRATAQQTAGLMLVDLDNFKVVNDRYGHAFGDEYIRAAASAMASAIRRSDCIGRIGGDEFAILLGEMQQPELEAGLVAERIRDALRRVARGLGRPELGKVSIGVSICPSQATSYDDAFRLADIALYEAKGAGRDTWRLYAATMGQSANRRAARAELVEALGRGEFEPYYQPKVNLSTRRIAGFEVLARWNHPERGVLAPACFALALTDRIVAPVLTRAMLGAALRDFAKWRRDGLRPGKLSVNASTADLKDIDFVPELVRMLEQWDLTPADMILEVTETVVLGSKSEGVYETLRKLRVLGAEVALDDFGTGYGGLQHLRSWPIDHVKIDKTFIEEVLSSEHDQAILRAILQLAGDLDIKVVAEGIERREQAELLSRLGCDRGQGYHFARPMPASAVPGFLAAWRDGESQPSFAPSGDSRSVAA